MGLAPTPSQTVGPYFELALPYEGGSRLVAEDDPDALRIEGAVYDGAGEPVADALVEVWQANRAGRYAHPEDARAEPALEEGFTGFGRCATDADGRFWFTTVKPGPLPAPAGGAQAPHLAVGVLARGLLKRVATRMYFPDEEAANAADPLLASIADPDLRATLVAREVKGVLRFDVHLQGERETAFLAV